MGRDAYAGNAGVLACTVDASSAERSMISRTIKITKHLTPEEPALQARAPAFPAKAPGFSAQETCLSGN